MAVPEILLASASYDWHTPKKYIELVRKVLGTINLDPASCSRANLTVRAEMYYDIHANGLGLPWPGKVFLNPPYGVSKGKSNQAIWSQRLVEQYDAGITTEAILLVNAVTGNRWFSPLWRFPICFTDHRIHFENTQGEQSQPTFGNVFIYLGNAAWRFDEVFHGVVGHVVMPREKE